MTEIYNFTDASYRKSQKSEQITDYITDHALGSDIEAVLAIKWTNQREHDAYLRNLLARGWDASRGLSNAPNNRARAKYYDGLIARAALNIDHLDLLSCETTEMLQPTGAHIDQDGNEVYASGKELLIAPLGNLAMSRTIRHPMFARLHSAEFSPDGRSILTASSALDIIYEIDRESSTPKWTMDIWQDTPFNKNGFGQLLYRQHPPQPESKQITLQNPDPLFMKDNPESRDAICIIDNPDRYQGLGLPTALMPAFINSVSYGHDDTILATSYQKGEGWIINRTDRNVHVIAKDLKRPHGLHKDPFAEGYMVTDTVGERVIYISKDLKNEHVVDFQGLHGKKAGLETAGWLQYTTRLDANVYCAALTSRQKLVLFNPSEKTKREISLDPDWGVQMVISKNRV